MGDKGPLAVGATSEPAVITYNLNPRVGSFLQEDHYAGLFDFDGWVALYEKAKAFLRIGGVTEDNRGEGNYKLFVDQAYAQYSWRSGAVQAGRLFLLDHGAPLSLDGVAGRFVIAPWLGFDAYVGWPVDLYSEVHDDSPSVGAKLSLRPIDGLIFYTRADYRKPFPDLETVDVGLGGAYSHPGLGSLQGMVDIDPLSESVTKGAARLTVLTDSTWRVWVAYQYDQNPLASLLKGHPLEVLFPGGQVYVDGEKVADGPTSLPRHQVDLAGALSFDFPGAYRLEVMTVAGLLMRESELDGYQLNADIRFSLLDYFTQMGLTGMRRDSETDGGLSQLALNVRTTLGPVVLLATGYLNYVEPADILSLPPFDVPAEFYMPSPGQPYQPEDQLSGGGRVSAEVAIGEGFYVAPVAEVLTPASTFGGSGIDVRGLVQIAWRPSPKETPSSYALNVPVSPRDAAAPFALKHVPHFATPGYSGTTYLDMDDNCSTCHRPKDSGQLRPKEKVCVSCHDEIEEKNCDYCHTEKPSAQIPPNIDHRIYGQHTTGALGVACPTCHTDNGEGVPTLPSKGAEGTCNTCHTKRQVVVHPEANWKSTHQYSTDQALLATSAVPLAQCSHCHQPVKIEGPVNPTTTCLECHKPREPLEAYSRNHLGSFQGHGASFWANPSECSTCHSGSGACLACHGKNDLTPETASPDKRYHAMGWIDRWSPVFHGNDFRAESLKASCATACHTGNTCGTCHQR
ncbi:MAG: hypothetical protein HYU97_08300 [Deltaproteobacteria bacterium]|nr:hypothetical protein [Deltaproteobacteria bacterium]